MLNLLQLCKPFCLQRMIEMNTLQALHIYMHASGVANRPV
jgi:hypothetical protein